MEHVANLQQTRATPTTKSNLSNRLYLLEGSSWRHFTCLPPRQGLNLVVLLALQEPVDTTLPIPFLGEFADSGMQVAAIQFLSSSPHSRGPILPRTQASSCRAVSKPSSWIAHTTSRSSSRT